MGDVHRDWRDRIAGVKRRPPVDERVLGPNPFPLGDSRHALWRDASRSAAEDEAAVLAEALRRIEVCPEDQLSIELISGITHGFDIRARYLTALMVRTYDDIAAYEQALPHLVDAVVALARGMCPSFLDRSQFADQVRTRLTTHVAHWQHQALKLIRETEDHNDALARSDGAGAELRCSSWHDVAIVFLSDRRVQVTVPGGTYTENYAEMGFEDRKAGRPNGAWEMLRTIAEGDGRISKSRLPWRKVEKRVQEIRRALRAHFQERKITVPPDDPMPYVKGEGYVAAFRLTVGRPYHS